MLFHAMNIALIIGGLNLVITFLFLLANLSKADETLWYCLPGFCLGIVLIILYSIGFQKLSANQKHRGRYNAISFKRHVS